MKKKTAVLLILVVIVASVFLSSCSLFGGGDDSGETTLDDLYYYSPGDYFITNVKDSDSRLCKVSVSIALTGKDQTTFLEENNAVIRDTIVKIMRSYTEEELATPDIIDTLSERMTTTLQEVLGMSDVWYVYINDFVVQ